MKLNLKITPMKNCKNAKVKRTVISLGAGRFIKVSH